MSVYLVNNVEPSGAPAAQLIRRFREWTWVYFQVVGANAVRIATERSTLENLTGSGAVGGIKLAGGSTAIFQGWWHGELWAIADAAGAQPAQFDLELMHPHGVADVTHGTLSHQDKSNE